MSDLKQVVIEYLKNEKEPKKSDDIAKAVDTDKKEVTKVINKLKKEGIIYSPKRCYYQVKED